MTAQDRKKGISANVNSKEEHDTNDNSRFIFKNKTIQVNEEEQEANGNIGGWDETSLEHCSDSTAVVATTHDTISSSTQQQDVESSCHNHNKEDHNSCSESTLSEQESSCRKMRFPEKLMQLLDMVNENKLEQYINWVSWSPCGNSFIIQKYALFEKHVLPEYFLSDGKIESFTRKLYRWGFTKCTLYTSKQLKIHAYSHKYFKRYKPELCKEIKFLLPVKRKTMSLSRKGRTCNSPRSSILRSSCRQSVIKEGEITGRTCVTSEESSSSVSSHAGASVYSFSYEDDQQPKDASYCPYSSTTYPPTSNSHPVSPTQQSHYSSFDFGGCYNYSRIPEELPSYNSSDMYTTSRGDFLSMSKSSLVTPSNYYHFHQQHIPIQSQEYDFHPHQTIHDKRQFFQNDQQLNVPMLTYYPEHSQPDLMNINVETNNRRSEPFKYHNDQTGGTCVTPTHHHGSNKPINDNDSYFYNYHVADHHGYHAQEFQQQYYHGTY